MRPLNYSPRHKPFEHQKKALKRIKNTRAFALLMEMGTGKTKVIIDEFAERIAGGDKTASLLVEAPKGVYRNWEGELEEHLSPDLYRLIMIYTWVRGKSRRKRGDRERFLSCRDRPRIMLVNTEAVGRVQPAYDMCDEFLGQGSSTHVVDESTKIRRWKTDQTKNTIALGRKATRRRILSGLPTPRSPLDLFSQFDFLDPDILGFSSFFSFRARFAVLKRMVIDKRTEIVGGFPEKVGGRPVDIVVGYKNQDELRQKIEPFSYRVTKEECLDLPPKIYLPPRVVEMTPEQEKHYREVLEDCTTELASGDHVTATLVIVQLQRLQQILCGFVKDENGKLHEIPERRTDEVMDVLEEFSGRKALIWTKYKHSAEKLRRTIAKEYGSESVVDYYGATSSDDRELAKKRFQKDDACRFFVGTPSTGGMGLTLTAATLSIYHSNSYDLEHRLQSEDRPHRAGQTEHVTYVDLVCPGTGDEKILHALRAKLDLATAIMGEGWRSWVV